MDRNQSTNGSQQHVPGTHGLFFREVTFTDCGQAGIPAEPHQYALYSPLSVVNAIRFGVIQNYWNNTETYEALAEYIRMDFDELKDTIALLMDGGRVKPDLSTYQNDMTTFHSKDDILALLIHLGYLGYDSSTREVFIPNKEILEVFRSSTKTQE